MSEMGQTRPFGDVRCMVALPPKAEVCPQFCDVRDWRSLKQAPEPRLRGSDAEKDQNNNDDGDTKKNPSTPPPPLSIRRLAIVVRDNGRRRHRGKGSKQAHYAASVAMAAAC
jgi:hypothetical protein